jgi:hypothetical protein
LRKYVDSRVFSMMLWGKKLTVTLIFDLENQQGSRFSWGLNIAMPAISRIIIFSSIRGWSRFIVSQLGYDVKVWNQTELLFHNVVYMSWDYEFEGAGIALLSYSCSLNLNKSSQTWRFQCQLMTFIWFWAVAILE